MTTTIINDIMPWNQFTATAAQTVFNCSYTADETTDIDVYRRGVGVSADDVAQIIAASLYTVTFIGADRIVRVTFGAGVTLDDVITIVRNTPASRTNLYTNINFTPTMLNTDFNFNLLREQQNELYSRQNGPRYNVSETIAQPTSGLGGDVILPKLTALRIWRMNAAGTEIELAQIPTSAAPDTSTYYTKDDETANLPNSIAVDAFATGFATTLNATGFTTSRVMTGTANQIDIANGDGTGVPTWTLSASVDMPGTFDIQSTTAVSSILDEDDMSSDSATALSTQQAIKAYSDSLQPLTTKGDIFTYAATVERLAVGGTDRQVLQVLSGEATGLVWSTSTYADTFAASTLLYANTANTVEGLATANSAMLYTDVSGVPAMSASLTDGQIMIGDTGGSPVPATMTAGAGMSIVNAAGSITFISTGGGYTWNEVTGTSDTLDVGNGYIANNAGLVTLTLPAAAAVGDTLAVQGKGAGLWLIAQNAGQTVHFGASDTTTGAGGSLAATNRYDSLELVCITANTDFAILTGPQGILTVV